MRGRRASRAAPGARRPCRSGRPRRAARVARGGPPRARLRETPAVRLAPEVVHRAGEAHAVEPEPGRRRLGDARARREGRARATGDERAHERSEAAPHGWASGTMTPAPMRYAGGRLIGSLPVIGTFPRSASATARSEARTPLQAIRYDRTVGVWVRR